ncbi:sodium:solute symporter family protein [Siminovitchia acidinfaciens]|uniref:Sodium:solute symporter family protein n=1 Tax=Siminovitchia acidinfaciens TaxID=2321395 RepID=A0A429XTQ9_9BACI|nr:sodium:solute symporter family protein [Siminovitchia acidinfaciens]RST71230.1 sodium:solute symporter family protein [Siminovitchia acidinfaciens]
MAFSIGILVSFVIFMVIGIGLSRKVSSVEEYYVSGRNAGTLLITGSLVASFLSTVAFMGEVGFSYDGYPILLLILTIFNASGYVFGVLFFGKYLRRSKALTLPEYFGKRYDSSKVRTLTAATTIFGVSAYLIAVTQGGAVLLSEILEVKYAFALILMWVVYTSFTTLSGAKGVLVTDTFMFLLFSIATFISIPLIIKAVGGWPGAVTEGATLAARPDLLSWHGITGEGAYMGTPGEALAWAIIMGLVWGFVIAVSPWQTSRYLMAKNEHVAIRSGVIAMISLITLYLFLQIGTSLVSVVNPDIVPSEKVFIWAAQNLLPTGVGVIAVSGILAAAISSCSTFLQLIGNSVTRDLLPKAQQGQLPDKQALKLSRISMLGVSVIILLITFWQPPSVMWIGYFAATLFAASWGPAAFFSIYSKKVTKTAAFWSIIFGFLGVVGGEVLKLLGVSLPIYLHPAIIGFALSTITIIVVSQFTTVTEAERTFQAQLRQLPAEELDSKEQKLTARYPYFLMASGILIILITFIFYYLPISKVAF